MDMNPTVYFADKALCFTSRIPSQEWFALWVSSGEEVSRDNILKILESHNKVALLTSDSGAAFEAFAAQFARVEAAGGVVVNQCGEWLMIRRNGRWDLPKGHVECGEATEVCAAREIAEETGVCGAEVVRPLCQTLHAYYFPKTERWELKRTHWYELRITSCPRLQPQTEEGIEQVAWCSVAQVGEYLQDAFPTIRCVAESMENETPNQK